MGRRARALIARTVTTMNLSLLNYYEAIERANNTPSTNRLGVNATMIPSRNH